MNIDTALNELLEIAKQLGANIIPPYQQMEAFTVGAFDGALARVHGGDAFSLLEHACHRYSSVKTDRPLLRGYLILITDLARQTNTTELPDGMLRIVNENPDQTSELRQWYRLSIINSH